ncbi:MAG: hypothetical protein PUA56_01350 [Bacillales bacterium]|nr:hypothetical protein [Bacillales bacterium]
MKKIAKIFALIGLSLSVLIAIGSTIATYTLLGLAAITPNTESLNTVYLFGGLVSLFCIAFAGVGTFISIKLLILLRENVKKTCYGVLGIIFVNVLTGVFYLCYDPNKEVSEEKKEDSKLVLWARDNLRIYEKWVLTGASVTIIVLALVWNIVSDTVFSSNSAFLIYESLTGLLGGALIFLATSINLFDVKKNGLIAGTVGIFLSLGHICFYPLYIASNTVAAKYAGTAKILGYIFMGISVVSCIALVVGIISSYLRKFSKALEDNTEIKIIFKLQDENEKTSVTD